MAWTTKRPEDAPDSDCTVLSSRTALRWLRLNYHEGTYVHITLHPASLLCRRHFPLVNWLFQKKKARQRDYRSPHRWLLFSVPQRHMSPSKSDGLCLVSRLPDFARQFFPCWFVILGDAPLKHHPRQTAKSISCRASQKRTGQNHILNTRVPLVRKKNLSRKLFLDLFH